MHGSQIWKRKRPKGRYLWSLAWMLVNRVSTQRHVSGGKRATRAKACKKAAKQVGQFRQEEPPVDAALGMELEAPAERPLVMVGPMAFPVE